MADVLCHEIVAQLSSTGDARADVHELCATVRRVLLRRRDSARILAQSPLVVSEGAIALMDRLLALLDGLVPGHALNTAGDTLLSFVTGYVQQEQIPIDPSALDPAVVARWAAQYPRVFADHAARSADRAGGTARSAQASSTSSSQFDTAIAAVLAGFVALPAVAGSPTVAPPRRSIRG